MKVFTDNQGKEWTEDSLNSLDTMPPGIFFHEFNLDGAKIKRLPKNLNIDNHLDLCESSVEELQSGLRVEGELSLNRSRVLSLPSDLRAISLSLVGSSVQKIGPNIKVRRLAIQSTAALTHPIACQSIVCYALTDTDQAFDFSNIRTDAVTIGSSGLFNIRNVKAPQLQISSSSAVNGELAINLQNSEIDKILIDGPLTSSRKLHYQLSFNNVVSQELFILLNINTYVTASIIRAHITEVIIDSAGRFNDNHHNFQLLDLRLEGNLNAAVSSLKSHPGLFPDNSVICGNLTIPKDLIIPESLCCLGSIKYV